MENNIKCSFCGKNKDLGNSVLFKSQVDIEMSICKDCIDDCNSALEIFNEENNISKQIDNTSLLRPSQLKAFFDDYIINQEDAKKILSVAVYNHYKRVYFNKEVNTDMKLKKSNVLMVGPSGSGKTLFVETMAKKLGVPFAIQDSTSLSQAGYVGDDPEVMLRKLIDNANGDIKLAERGIVFLDEVDKIGRKGENTSITRDVSGEGVQQALLKMLEGNIVSVPTQGARKHPQQECYQIDTTNILFICGGAFENIEKIIEKRVNKKSKIGFSSDDNRLGSKDSDYNDLIKKITPKDLRAFGMMPEVLGRLPVICPLEELDEKALVRILTEPVDSIVKQFKTLLEIEGVELEFEEECLKVVANKAIESGTGARALRAIMESFMNEYMFVIPDMNVAKITLTKDCVTKTGKPVYEMVKAI